MSAPLQRAETEHAPVPVLADPQLMICSKRNSAALALGFPSVAHAVTSERLLLRGRAGSKEQSDHGRHPRVSRPVVRGPVGSGLIVRRNTLRLRKR